MAERSYFKAHYEDKRTHHMVCGSCGTTYGLAEGENIVCFQVSESLHGKVVVGGEERSPGRFFALTQEQTLKWIGPDVILSGIVRVVSGFLPPMPALRKIDGICPFCGEEKLFEKGDHEKCGGSGSWCASSSIDWDSIPLVERLAIFEWSDE